MIPAVHIHKQAARDGVKEQTVEKDYALTWFLLALGHLPDMRKLLRFKGGTCIRKMYFPHWRYSEDIDFTLTQPIPAKDIHLMVDTIAKKASQLSGVVFQPQAAEPIEEAGRLESEVVYVDYIGPLQRTGTPRKFKVDVTAGELLIGSPAHRKVLGLFEDQKESQRELPVYTLEEICSEKMRSLLQRREPRDLYDIWRLLGEVQELDRPMLVQMFQEKCEFKKLKVPALKDVLGGRNVPTLEKLWKARLQEQKADLPHFEQVVRETRRLLRVCES
jgi:predicted nucleotidyltransferase component of viral defense system